MSLVHHLPPGYTLVYPNREKQSSRTAKASVVAVLLLSAVVILAITIGGWNRLEGMTPLSFAWVLVYVLIAFYVSRWARGLLPVAASLATLLLVPLIVSLSGLGGTTWSERGGSGYGPVRTIFGGGGFSPGALSLLTIVLLVIQLALIVVCVRAFMQAWNIEAEVPEAELTEAQRRNGSARSERSARAQGVHRR